MVISQPAVYCLEASKSRLADGFVVRWWRRLGGGRARAAHPRPDFPSFSPADSTGAAVVAPVAPSPIIAEPVAAVGAASAEPEAEQLTATERRARAAALRGLFLARQRRFPAAERAFAEAVRLDPALDLATIPTFWDLERAAHEGIVRVYETEGHGRRAAVLAARLKERFRPRLVPPRAKHAEQAGASIG